MDREDTKKRLLVAASGIFAEKGFREATIQDICTAAGANVAAVNYHFGSKKNLYLEVWRSASEILKERCLKPMERITNPEARMRAIIDQRIRQTFAEGPAGQLRKLTFREMSAPTEFNEKIRKRFLRPFRDLLTKTVAEILEVDAQDPMAQHCAFSLHSQLIFLNVLRMRGRLHHLDFLTGSGNPSDQQIEALSEHIATFVMGGIKATSTSKNRAK